MNKTRYPHNLIQFLQINVFLIQLCKILKPLFIVTLITIININGYSQENKNKLSVNPLQLFAYNLKNIEYERGFINGKLGVSFFYGHTGFAIRQIEGYSSYIDEQNISIKRYFRNFSENSFWYGAQLSVASARIYGDNGLSNISDMIGIEQPPKAYMADRTNMAENVGTLGLTGKLGYQIIFKSFYLDVFSGVGYALTNNLFGDVVYTGNLSETHLLLTYGIKTGISF